MIGLDSPTKTYNSAVSQRVTRMDGPRSDGNFLADDNPENQAYVIKDMANDSSKDGQAIKGTLLYPTGEKMYVGEFINKQRNGYGKLWHKTGVLRFEGIFLNDKIHQAQIKTYHPTANLKYEGDIFEGLKQGLGVYFHENGNLFYKGNFLDDRFHMNDAEHFYPNNI
jgi:antitoxin component YwqK of YwqJK toxin-antitoxin module